MMTWRSFLTAFLSTGYNLGVGSKSVKKNLIELIIKGLI